LLNLVDVDVKLAHIVSVPVPANVPIITLLLPHKTGPSFTVPGLPNPFPLFQLVCAVLPA
jgi:hypothetical protein